MSQQIIVSTPQTVIFSDVKDKEYFYFGGDLYFKALFFVDGKTYNAIGLKTKKYVIVKDGEKITPISKINITVEY